MLFYKIKKISNLLILCFFCNIFSCTQIPESKEVKQFSEYIEGYNKNYFAYFDDSAQIENCLQQVISHVSASLPKDSLSGEMQFPKKHEGKFSGDVTDLKFYFGNIFDSARKHLRINVWQPSDRKLFYYVLDEKNVFKRIGGFDQIHGGDSYADTLLDVNSDGYKDFIEMTYSSSGCCLREKHSIYLYRPADGFFENYNCLYNPTYSPSEKIVRGVEVGHAGQVPIYKYKWRNSKLYVLAYILPHPKKAGKYLKIKNPLDTTGKLLHSLPEEYKNINGIDWFLDTFER